MKDVFGMMKQVQEMQGRMQKAQEDLAALRIDGEAGAGMVKITLDGKGEMRAIRIDPALAKPDEIEMLEDLILAASQDARAKVEVAMQDMMKDVTGGLPLPPGLKLF